ncbi:MAG: hypothetical protein ABSB74_08490 [Tepidisphaeraceae bacterium]
MPFTPMQILAGMVLPAVLLGVAIALAWRPWSRRATADARWVFAPIIAIGFCIAYWNFELKPGWPPGGNVLFLLFYFAVPVGILGLLDSLLKPPLWLRAVVLLLLWRIFVRLLLLPQIPRQISAPNAELWIDALSLIALGWWLTFEHLADRSPGVVTPLILAAVAGASAILLAMGWHIQASGAMAGALVAMSIAAMVLATWNSRISFSRGFAQTIVLLLQLILIHGYFYTDDALTTGQQIWAGLLLASPLLAFTGDLPVLRRQRPAWRLAVRAIPVLIALGIVCAATVRNYARADQAQPTMQDE